MHFSIWSKPFEAYVVPVCSDRFWKKSVHLKIALDMVQMIWTFDIFMTKLQNCKNNLVQNSDTRGTMIFNCLKMVILRPLEFIVPLVSEFWTKLFLQSWSFVMKISKVQIIWTMSSTIFKWTIFFRNGHYIRVLHKLQRAWSILKNSKSLKIMILVNHLCPKASPDQTSHAS